MIGAIMFILLIGLMFLGVPIAFSMGLSAILMLLINATATPVAITTRAVNSLDSFTTMAIPFFMMASFILTGSKVGVEDLPLCRYAGASPAGRPGSCERADLHDHGRYVRLCRVRRVRHRPHGDGRHGGGWL